MGSVKDWFGSADLGALFAMGLGILIFLVSSFAFFKLFMQKRRIRRIIAEQEAKATDEESRTENTQLNQREEDEGDLFGVRALEKGFTGGVYQSRANTPDGSRHASLVSVNPQRVRIPYGKAAANLSGSTIALDMGATSPGPGKGPELRSAAASVLDSASSTRSNSPETAHSGLSSRSGSPGQQLRSTQFRHDDDISEMNTYRRSKSPVQPQRPTRFGPDGSMPESNVYDPEYTGPRIAKPSSVLVVPGQNSELERVERGSTASIGDVYDSYYSRRNSRLQAHTSQETVHEEEEEVGGASIGKRNHPALSSRTH